MDIYEAINKVSHSVGKIQKDGKNPHFKSSYTTLNGLREALDPILIENNIIVFQNVIGKDLKTKIMLKGSSEVIEGSIELIGAGNMQQTGSAITYARRYSLVVMFGILDTDDDGEQSMNRKPIDPIVIKQQELLKIIGDDIKLANEIKATLKITNSLDKMTMTELDSMINEARKV